MDNLNNRIWRALASLGGKVLQLHLLRVPFTQNAGRQPPAAVHGAEKDGEDSPSGAKQKTLDDWKEALRSAVGQFPMASAAPPLFSIITPAFNTKPEWLAEAALSVLQQNLTDWEWLVVDDASPETAFHAILSELEGIARVTVRRLERRAGISAATNAGLQMARGRFFCVLDHDDVLAPEALSRCAAVLEAGFDAVYTDEEKINEVSVPFQPFHKPDWSPEYFRNLMYIGHLLCVRRDLAYEIGGFDSRYDRIQDYEFFLRYSERTGRIAHINRVLYRWRAVQGSIAADQQAKGDLEPLQLAAVQAHLDRMNFPADAGPGRAVHAVRIMPRPRASSSKISVVVLACGGPQALSRYLASLARNTTYADLELIGVHIGSGNIRTTELMQAFEVKHLYCGDRLNQPAAQNFGAGKAAGRYLAFLGSGVEILTPDWAEQMLYYAEQGDVGAVGGLVVNPNQTVQQAGLALSPRSAVRPMWSGQRANSDGYFASLACAHEVTAVSADCLMIRKDLFLDLGGFDPCFLTAGHDVDLCLRLLSVGKRNIFTPYARFLDPEAETANRGIPSADRHLLACRWQHSLETGDRCYRAAPPEDLTL